MDDSRRKLPSWMLGVKSNENTTETSNNNGCQKEEDNGKLVKARRQGKRVTEKRRKIDGGNDEFEAESSDVPTGCDGGNRRIGRKANGGSGYVEGNDVKGSFVDDMVDDEIGYGKRKNGAKVRKGKLRSNLVDSDDYVDGDNGVPGEKRNKGGRKRRGKGKSDAVDSKKPELEEAEDDDGGGAQVVMRKCNGRLRADRDREKLIDGNDVVDVEGTPASISDDEDLTVEDLVSIAEEYVNNDMEAAQKLCRTQDVSNAGNLMRIRKQHTIESEEIGEKHNSATSIHDNTQSGGSFNIKLLNCEEARPRSLLNENVTVVKPIMSDDPTQGMLDLFLGHLLKRPQPQEEEKKLDISLGVQRQEPVDPPVDGVPFTKKKSSLKDKVAMFFD